MRAGVADGMTMLFLRVDLLQQQGYTKFSMTFYIYTAGGILEYEEFCEFSGD